jgi:hypothetical protein
MVQVYHKSVRFLEYIYLFPAAPHLEHRASVKCFVSPQSVGLLGWGISPTQGHYFLRVY